MWRRVEMDIIDYMMDIIDLTLSVFLCTVLIV